MSIASNAPAQTHCQGIERHQTTDSSSEDSYLAGALPTLLTYGVSPPDGGDFYAVKGNKITLDLLTCGLTGNFFSRMRDMPQRESRGIVVVLDRDTETHTVEYRSIESMYPLAEAEGAQVIVSVGYLVLHGENYESDVARVKARAEANLPGINSYWKAPDDRAAPASRDVTQQGGVHS